MEVEEEPVMTARSRFRVWDRSIVTCSETPGRILDHVSLDLDIHSSD